jgi:hypothetical protein
LVSRAHCETQRHFKITFSPSCAVPSDSFSFAVNGTVIESDLAEAVAVAPAVREQLSVDGCARHFTITASGIQNSDISTLLALLSGRSIKVVGSLARLTRFLSKPTLERVLLHDGFSGTLLELAEKCDPHSRFERHDLLDLLLETLDGVLSSGCISTESEDAPVEVILRLGEEYRSLLRYVWVGNLSREGFSVLAPKPRILFETVWYRMRERIAPSFKSRILSELPPVFSRFDGKRFSLLWPGSRDGFEVNNFHGRCDGRANTLTVILDADGNIFGGFMPLPWKSSRTDASKNDGRNWKSFVFTLQNPHNITARTFEVRTDENHLAIDYTWKYGVGPVIGNDIIVMERCSTNTNSRTSLGWTYLNETNVDGAGVFTGKRGFNVAEIEDFEIPE